MGVRVATDEDMPRLLGLCRAFHAESQYSGEMDFCEKTIKPVCAELIKNECLLMTDNGVIGFMLFPCFFNSEHLMAQELFWFVEKHKRGTRQGVQLIKAAEEKAKSKGAKAMIMLCLENNRIDALYSKLGYNKAETSYMRAL